MLGQTEPSWGISIGERLFRSKVTVRRHSSAHAVLGKMWFTDGETMVDVSPRAG